MRFIYISVCTLVLTSGCSPHPKIFEYSFEMLDVVIVEGQSVDGNFTNTPNTTYTLSFGANDMGALDCASDDPDRFRNQIDTIRPVAWQVGGLFSSAGTGAAPIRHRLEEGTRISHDLNYHVAIDDCGSDAVLGAGVIPAGTQVSAMPTQLDNPYTNNSTYRPSMDTMLFDWAPFDNSDALLDVMMDGLSSASLPSTGVDFGFEVSVCMDPLYFEPTGTDPNEYGSVVMVHVVSFELEGEGHPCTGSSGEEE